jgi:hypothetical protein
MACIAQDQGFVAKACVLDAVFWHDRLPVPNNKATRMRRGCAEINVGAKRGESGSFVLACNLARPCIKTVMSYHSKSFALLSLF